MRIETSPILDLLVEKLKQTTLEEDVEPTTPVFRRSFGGPSWDFAGYRNYSVADDSSQIDWKASVKTNKILVKEYNEIQTLKVFFLLDTSSSMLLGTTGKRKLDFASEVVAALSYSILKAKGEVTLSLFDKRINKIIFADDIKLFYNLTDNLSNSQFTDSKADLNTASRLIATHTKKGTFLILISDFLNLGEKWQESINFLGSKSHLIGIMIRDPIDKVLPKGVNKVFIQEPGSERSFLFNVRRYRKKYAKLAQEQELEVKKILTSANADFLLLHSDQVYMNELVNLFKRGVARFH